MVGKGENAYLRHLTRVQKSVMMNNTRNRGTFRFRPVIANTGYPGYFLIVQDFIKEARKMGVSVGPGRGSAADQRLSLITNIDPIKYDLLFEFFES